MKIELTPSITISLRVCYLNHSDQIIFQYGGLSFTVVVVVSGGLVVVVVSGGLVVVVVSGGLVVVVVSEDL